MIHHPLFGWVLALLALVAGYAGWGARGLVLAVTVIAFWLLLQFNRAMRAMRQVARAPVGSTPSAVMLHAKLKPGMTLAEMLPMAGSLGEALDAGTVGDDEAQRYRWRDAGDREVVALLRGSRLVSWTLDGQPAVMGGTVVSGSEAGD